METIGWLTIVMLLSLWLMARREPPWAFRMEVWLEKMILFHVRRPLQAWLLTELTEHLERWLGRIDRDLKVIDRDVERASSNAQHARDQVKALINLDIGQHRDCGWLVLITKVKGQDRVMLQELKSEMTMDEYDDLVERLKHDCGAVLGYTDAPRGYAEVFLQRHKVRVSRR